MDFSIRFQYSLFPGHFECQYLEGEVYPAAQRDCNRCILIGGATLTKASVMDNLKHRCLNLNIIGSNVNRPSYMQKLSIENKIPELHK